MLAVRWSVKYFFTPNSPLFRKSGGEKKKKDNHEALCFSSKGNKTEAFCDVTKSSDYSHIKSIIFIKYKSNKEI